MSLSVLILFAIYMVLPYAQDLYYSWAISNGDVTLGPTATVAPSTSITSSIANLGTDHVAYTWFKGAAQPTLRLNIPFDNTGGTDFSGLSHTVNTTGTTYVTGQTPGDCVAGGCLSFNGTASDVVDVPHNGNLAFFDGDFTAEAWVNFSTSHNGAIMSKRKGTNPFEAWFLAITGSGNCTSGGAGTAICFGICNSSCTVVTSADGYDDGQWHYVVGRKTGDTYELFVDNVSQGSFTRSTTISNTSDISIGKTGEIAAGFLNGKLDELKISDYAKTTNEITQSFTDGGNGISGPSIIHSDATSAGETWKLLATPISEFGTVGTPIESTGNIFVSGSTLQPSHITLNTTDEGSALDPTISTPPAGSDVAFQFFQNGSPLLDSYWPFHGGASKEFDISGNLRDGTPVSSPSIATSGCVAGNCLDLDGNSGFINVSDEDLSSLTAITISAWFKGNGAFPNSAAIVSNVTGCATSGYLMWLNRNGSQAGRVSFWTGNGPWTDSSANTYADDQWHHVVATFDGTTRNLYVDGALSVSQNHAGDSLISSRSLQIGNSDYGCGSAHNGQLDEILIYDRVISDGERLALYNAGLAEEHYPQSVPASLHNFNDTFDISAFEIGSVFGPMEIGSVTISSAPATSNTITTPSGIQSFNVSVDYTCSLDGGGSATRDQLVEIDDGGGGFSSATIVSTTDGTVNASTIEGMTCDGSTNTVVVDTVADNVALGTTTNSARIRITPQVGTSTPGTTNTFTVTNPTISNITSSTTMNPGDFVAGTAYFVSGVSTVLTINQTFQDSTINIHSLYVSDGATVTHPVGTDSQIYKVDLTASNIIQVQAGASISTDGRGCGNGRRDDEAGACTSSGATTSAVGGGGSHGGSAGVNSVAVTYGSITNPVTVGGGGSTGGFGGVAGIGGGAIKLTANEVVLSGDITSNGTSGSASDGAGGSVWIDTTLLSGTGTVSANGGSGASIVPAGGGGRIALEYDSSAAGNDPITTVRTNLGFESYGGDHNGGGGSLAGSAGSSYFEDTSIHAADGGIVYYENDILASAKSALASTFDTFAGLIIDQSFVVAETINVTSVSLLNGAELSHPASTTSTTYNLDITATDLIIDATSKINADGLGCGNGRRPDGLGACDTAGAAIAATTGGGSHGGRGGEFASAVIYGSVTEPILQGGGGSTGGFGGVAGLGGGAVKIIASNFTLNGAISANGTSSSASDGAGGSIWIDISSNFNGSGGTIEANGGDTTGSAAAGGGGRVALYYNSATGTNPALATLRTTHNITAYGGDDDALGGVDAGSAGSVYFFDASVHSPNQGDIHYDNDILSTARTPLDDGVTYNDIFINQNYVEAQSLTVSALDLSNQAVLAHPSVSGSTHFTLDITATDITIDATSSISADDVGCPAFNVPTGSGTCSTTNRSTGIAGASHGGEGGEGSTPGPVYGDIFEPNLPGSGGNTDGFGGAATGGAGVIKIDTVNLVNNGSISSSVINTGSASSGSGGSIWVDISGLLSGTGSYVANGGAPTGGSTGSGGGGRIAMHWDSSVSGNPSVSTLRTTNTFQARGGIAPGGVSKQGAAGTIYFYDSDTHTLNQGDLVVDNSGNSSTTAVTPLFFDTFTGITVNDLFVINQAILEIDIPCAGANPLTVLGSIDLSGSGSIVNNQPGPCPISVNTPSVSTTNLTYETNQAGSEFLLGTGGYAPYTWACLDGPGGSIVACNTVLPSGLSLNTSTGEISGTPTVSGLTNVSFRLTDADPSGAQTAEDSVAFGVSAAPTAPTLLFVHSTNAQAGFSSPVSGIDATPVFSAICQDTDIGDTCDQYQIQVASDAGFGSIVWDSGATAMTSTAIGARSANLPFGGAALALDGATYYWRIKFFDNNGVEGVFSSSGEEFSTDLPPTAPTLLQSGDTTATLTNPVGLTSETPVFSAIFNDPDLTDTATAYRIQVDNDNDFSSIVWDSGAAGTAMPSCNQGTRCSDIIFGGTPLELNEALYYWRIAFYDAAGVVSPFSEDPISTNTFKMGSGGTSAQKISAINQQNSGGGDTSGDSEAVIIPNPPVMGPVQVLSPTSIKYNFIDDSFNEDGFRLIDRQGTVIKEVSQPNISSITLEGLEPNTVKTDIFVVAYNTAGQSLQSTAGNASPDFDYPDAVTHATNLLPLAISRTGGSVKVGTTKTLKNIGLRQSGKEFELLIPATGTSQQQVISSGYTQNFDYTFNNVPPNLDIQVRVRGRNQVGVATTFSNFITIAGGEFEGSEMSVSLSVRKSDTGDLPRPIKPDRLLTITIVAANNGDNPATDALMNLPLPRYMRYVSGSLSIDGIPQTDGVDDDIAQYGGHSVSTIWSRMNAGEGHIVSFQLGFDQERLKNLRKQLLRPISESDSLSNTDANQTEPNLQEVLGDSTGPTSAAVEAAASLVQVLQANIGNAESEQVVYSEAWEVEPEIEVFDEELEEEAGEELEEIPEEEQDDAVEEFENDPENQEDPAPLPPIEDEVEEVPSPDEDGDGFPDDIPDDEMDDIQDTIEDILDQEDLDGEGSPSESPGNDGEIIPPTISTPEEIVGPGLQPENPPIIDAVDFPDGEGSPSPVSDGNDGGPTTTPTKTQISGPSFSLETPFTDPETGEDRVLGVTGFAEENDDDIKFSGTTTEPYTVVTLIFNSETTAIAVSDSNGDWETFVSSDKLGVDPGQSKNVIVEAIAAKGDIRSERVEIAEVLIDRNTRGVIETDFNDEVSLQQSIIRDIQTSVQFIEPEIQTAAIVSLPLIIVSSAPIWGYLPLLPTILYNLLTLLLSSTKRRKRKERFGVVYNAITKEPLPLAIVRTYEKATGKLIATEVTDGQGRYIVLAKPGTYRIEVKKPQFTFPSRIVHGESDGEYQNLYQEGQGWLAHEELMIPNIAVDPIHQDKQFSLAGGLRKNWLRLQAIGSVLALPSLVIGSLISLMLVVSVPDKPLNWFIALVYIIAAVAQLKFSLPVERPWGVVSDTETGETIALTTLQLVDTSFGKVVKSRLSDYQGRFSFSPEPGEYQLIATKGGYEQVVSKDGLPEHFKLDKEHQSIKGNIAMQKQKRL